MGGLPIFPLPAFFVFGFFAFVFLDFSRIFAEAGSGGEGGLGVVTDGAVTGGGGDAEGGLSTDASLEDILGNFFEGAAGLREMGGTFS